MDDPSLAQRLADAHVGLESQRVRIESAAGTMDVASAPEEGNRVEITVPEADISAVKAMMQKVLHDVSARALQIHGSLGVTHEMPFVQYLVESFVLGLAAYATVVRGLFPAAAAAAVRIGRLVANRKGGLPDVVATAH